MGVRQESRFDSLEEHILVDGKRKEFEERFEEKRFRKRNNKKIKK